MPKFLRTIIAVPNAIAVVFLGCQGGLSCTSDRSRSSDMAVPRIEVEQSIDRALQFLESVQSVDGEFASVKCSDELLTRCGADSSPFPATYVLTALTGRAGERTKRIRDKAKRNLISTMESGYVWRYWPLGTPNSNLITPDLDDTAAARAALMLNGWRAPWTDEPFKTNATPQGAYWTWLNIAPEGNIVDCAVNANILFYFALSGSIPSKLVEYVKKQLELGRIENCSPFYVSGQAFYYHMTRAVLVARDLDALKPLLVSQIAKSRRPDGTFASQRDVLFGAAAVMTLFDTYTSSEHRLMRLLMGLQGKPGGFPNVALFRGPQNCMGNCSYFASQAISTALAIDALYRYTDKVYFSAGR